MGFNKRKISKEMIINNVNNLSYIEKLVNADALMIDNWSDNFYKKFNFKWEKYKELKLELINETRLYSDISQVLEHRNFEKMKFISNIFIELKTNPNWVDIHLINSILEEKIPDEISGNFDLLVNYFINKIDNLFNI
jgi:hypothetical protein